MPVKSPPRERPLLLMFLAEYENGAWKSATPDWVEERIDGAVEVVAETAAGLERRRVRPGEGHGGPRLAAIVPRARYGQRSRSCCQGNRNRRHRGSSRRSGTRCSDIEVGRQARNLVTVKVLGRIERLEARAPRPQRRIILVWLHKDGHTTKVADTHGHLPDPAPYNAYLPPYGPGREVQYYVTETD
jgi:hypothetical protein